MAFDPHQHPRDRRTGRFTGEPGKVTVRAADGSARTYRIERDRLTGQLIERLRRPAGGDTGDGTVDDEGEPGEPGDQPIG